MHFIGRAMIRRGWLDESRLPPADSLAVELRGPARDERSRSAVPATLDSLRDPNRSAPDPTKTPQTP
jgi:hypothetical protein